MIAYWKDFPTHEEGERECCWLLSNRKQGASSAIKIVAVVLLQYGINRFCINTKDAAVMAECETHGWLQEAQFVAAANQ